MNNKILDFINSGNKYSSQGEFDLALNTYNQALKLLNEKDKQEFLPQIELAITETYLSKYDIKKEKMFFDLAKEHFRKIYKFIPFNKNFTTKIIHNSMKLNMLEELTEKYRDLGDHTQAYKEFIHLSRTLTGLYVIGDIELHKYQQNYIIKIAFDFVLLPIGIFMLMFALLSPKFKKILFPGIVVLLIYIIYRVTIHYISPRKESKHT